MDSMVFQNKFKKYYTNDKVIFTNNTITSFYVYNIIYIL